MSKLKNLLIPIAAAIVVVLLMGAGGGATITGEQAKALVKKGGFLLDVRTPQEFAEGHIEGATNISVQDLEAKLGAFPAKKDQDVVIYCRSGRRSATAKQLLEKAGWTKVHDFGAMTNWK